MNDADWNVMAPTPDDYSASAFRSLPSPDIMMATNRAR